MGGAKKASLAQSEKQQQMQTTKQDGKQPKGAKPKATPDRKTGSSDISNLSEKELMAELGKMKAITPYQVASRYNVKVSQAKDILQRMENRGQIHMVASSGGTKVYRSLST
jgi:small subunit ribosomal protein S25e